jgi:hypothetical protein
MLGNLKRQDLLCCRLYPSDFGPQKSSFSHHNRSNALPIPTQKPRIMYLDLDLHFSDADKMLACTIRLRPAMQQGPNREQE